VPAALLFAQREWADLRGQMCHPAGAENALPGALDEARRVLNAEVAAVRDKWAAQVGQTHTKAWDPCLKFLRVRQAVFFFLFYPE
jgi:hypothetical protein